MRQTNEEIFSKITGKREADNMRQKKKRNIFCKIKKKKRDRQHETKKNETKTEGKEWRNEWKRENSCLYTKCICR